MQLYICKTSFDVITFLMLQPPILPCRLQQSTFGRIGLNRRVRYGNGCFSVTYRHSKSSHLTSLLLIPRKLGTRLRSVDVPLPHKSVICGDPVSRPTGSCLPFGKLTAMYPLLSPIFLFLSFRKEVIQPHLPIRLPCYDFTPVTGPAFDCSLHCWLGHRLRALPTPMV